MRALALPRETFDQLAAGRGDLPTVLRDGQLSRRLLLLRELRDAAVSSAPRLCAAAGTSEAFAVLADARRNATEAVDRLLLHPHVGAWLDEASRALLTGGDIAPEDLGHLGGLAAVAACAANRPFEVTAAIRDGVLPLPSLGAVPVREPSGWCRLRSRGDDTIEISTPSATAVVSLSTADTDAWLSLRRLTSTAGDLTIDLALDDLDPFRGCGPLPVDGRLDADLVAAWQAQLDTAWPLLVEHHRAWARAISSGLTTVVPLRPSREYNELSGTCHSAVGALSMTPPTSPLALALALVHELQHSELWALIDLVPLVEPSTEQLLYSPWKADPRPWMGLLHGAYAFLGLAEFWGVEREAGGRLRDDVRQADFELALARMQVRDGLQALDASGRLTEPGHRFVSGLSQRLATLDQLTVPHPFQILAQTTYRDHRISWRLRNSRPDPDQVDERARAWITGRSCPQQALARTIVVGDEPMPSDARRDFIVRTLCGRPSLDGHPPPTDADRLLIDGHDDEAADEYRAQIARQPDDAASWAGLALAWRARRSSASEMLADAPDVVAAVYRAILQRSDRAPEVEAVAGWLSPSLVS